MRTRMSACAAVVLLLTVLCYPSSAFGTAETFSYRGELAAVIASFSSVDETGIQTDVDIVSGKLKRHVAPGPVTRESTLELNITRFDPDDPYNPLVRVIAFVPPQADVGLMTPAVSPGSWATLNTAIYVLDQVSNSWFWASIDLRWVCTGDIHREAYHHTFVEPGVSVDVRSTLTVYCDAQALGSVSDGVTNFTPAPSVEAFVTDQGGVEIEISIEQ